MSVILTILGVIVGLFLLKVFFIAILHIIKYGIAAFILVAIPIGFVCLVGIISGSTAWTICKWSFYLGSAYGLISAILHPGEYFSNVSDDLNSDSSSSTSSNNNNSSYSDKRYGTCAYCRYFSPYKRYGHVGMCTLNRYQNISDGDSCKHMKKI